MKRTPREVVKSVAWVAVIGLAVCGGVAASAPSRTAAAPAVTVTILYDNYASGPGLKTGWGFACLVQGFDKTVLFDTGADPAVFLANLRALKIDPSVVDIVFISHDHGDHTGALAEFLKLNNKVSVWLPGSLIAEVAKGLDEIVTKAGARVVRNRGPAEICPGLRSTGELAGVALEQALIIDTAEGSAVVTGCAHPGIVAILRRAREVTDREIALVLGGFHLLQTPAAELRTIVRTFKDELGVKKVGATHCTGDAAIATFKDAYGADFIQVGAGRVMTLAKGSSGGGA